MECLSCLEVLDHMPIGAFVLDREFRVFHWNKCLENWTGVLCKDIKGQDIRERYPRLKDVKYGVRLKPLFDGGPPIIFSHHLHKHLIPVELPDGTYRRQQCFASSITLGELGQTMAIITLQDVTEAYHRIKEIEQLRDEVMLELALRKRTEATLRESEERLLFLASTDELTQIANRRKFLDTLSREMSRAQRYGSPLSLIMLDADKFKSINDTFGHEIGDRVLATLADSIKTQLREVDLPGRLGGEEFGIMLPETGLEDAVLVAERIRAYVESQEVPTPDGHARFTVSLGVATLDPQDPDMTIQRLLKVADNALYAAKRGGRNRVVAHD